MWFQRIYVGLTVKLHFLKKLIFIPLFFLFFTAVMAQSAAPINTDSTYSFTEIENNTLLFIDTGSHRSMASIDSVKFTPLTHFTKRNKIPAKLIASTFYVRFTLQNASPVNKFYYYYPGKLYKMITLFKTTPAGQFTLEKTSKIRDGFVPIQIEAGKTNTYILQLKFFKTGFNEIKSTLIPGEQLKLFKNELYKSLNEKKTAGILLSGMLLMMILVALLNYYITKKAEFLYNSLYSLCMFLLIFLTNFLVMNPGWFKGIFISYLDLLLLITGTILYIQFTRYFLNTKEQYPRLNKFLILETQVIAILMIVYTILHFASDSYYYEIYLENLIKIVLLCASLIYIILSFVKKDPLMNYLAIGIATQIFFSIISFVFVITQSRANHIYNSPIFYFELGVICPIIFFLLGLFYKNRQELILKIKEQESMNLDSEKQSFKNELNIYKAQQEERNRISADMHDDLGAGMTSIRLYSELAKSKAGENILPEIEKISSSADDLINKMNAIIWSMSSQNDSLGNMVAYIRSYAIEYLDNTGIKPIISIPENLPKLIVNGTIRRNVFLMIKEALQNVVKHANATEVKISLNKEPEGFSLTIHDNGSGIDFNNIRQFSNGLRNMKKRMMDIEIDFSIENNEGTLIRLYKKTR
jgi:signal transduction histidine kinase